MRASHQRAAVQINFVGGSRRDLLIHVRSAGRGREGGWEVRSQDDVAALGPLDLRDPAHARRLEKALAEADFL